MGIVGLSFFWEVISAIDYAPFLAKCTRELFVFLRASWELMVGRECWLGCFETDTHSPNSLKFTETASRFMKT